MTVWRGWHILGQDDTGAGVLAPGSFPQLPEAEVQDHWTDIEALQWL